MKKIALYICAFLFAAVSVPAISIIDTSNYNQNFDSLAASGGASLSWANNSTLSGWHLFTASGGAISTYGADTGSSSTGNFWSYGSSGSSDRALGGLGSGGTYFGSPASGAVAGWIAVSFVNASSGTFNGFVAGWDGEQWRNGGNAAAHSMVFEYGFGSTFGSVSVWNAPGGSFDWSSLVNTTPAAAVVGNAAGLVAGKGGAITGLSWSAGDTLWLRWLERNDTGSDHGLALDNFTFHATAPAPSGRVPDALPLGFVVVTLLGLLLCASGRRVPVLKPVSIRRRKP